MNKLCRARAVPSASILHVIRSLRTPFEQMNMLELVRSGSVDHLRYCAGLFLLPTCLVQ